MILGRLLANRHKLVQAVQEELGGRLAALALFGSVVRAEMDKRGDLDFFVVVRDFEESLERRRRIYKVVHSAVNSVLSENWDVTVIDVDIGFVTDEHATVSSLTLNIVADAAVIYDPENVLDSFITRVTQLIQVAGLERYRTPDGKYGWKPVSGSLRPVEA